ncbi:cytochrome b-c1 complex subunit 1, mitochondrial-like [Leguminivora glycinivorella]|uniref:cytochrome b-c1 complex subunit 1, mitochondrial-like n=1 Tax=Leguminivora glycinivorella TaxID=1035111 RepID=UPI0020101BAF|nr:cytochrome b-c1 complex subunit 1, mitochondrial-like [Leguminivora glycinivorella]
MAFKGSTAMSKCGIENFVYASGSRLDARTTHEIQRFTVTCTPEWVQTATVLLSGIVNQLEMNPSEVEREKDNMCLELQDGDRNLKTIVFENLIQSAFQGTTLGLKVIGPSSNIERFDGCMAQTYMCSHYQPWRLVFACSGPVGKSYFLANVCNCLNSMSATCSDSDRGNSRYTASSVIYRDDSKKFLHAAVAFEAPGFLSEDYMTMRVLKNVIGSWNKSQSVVGPWPELAMRCADTELCESFESFYIAFGDVGLFGVYFVCDKMVPEDFLHNWQDVLKMTGCALRAGDAARAKRATKMELFRERAGSYNSCVSMGPEILYRGMRPTLKDYARAADILEPHELQELAYKWLYNAHPVISAAGPSEGLPDYNRLAASQYWLRL